MAQINWKQCDYEQRDDGIYYCTGNHPNDQPHEWEKFNIDSLADVVQLVHKTSLAFIIGDAARVAHENGEGWVDVGRAIIKRLEDLQTEGKEFK